MICSEEGCERTVLAKGLCSKHYYRSRYIKKTGEPQYAPFFHKEREYESRIHEIRVMRGLSVVELSKKADCSPYNISCLANGMMAPIYSEGQIRPVAHRICRVLGVSPEALFPRYFCDIERGRFAEDAPFLTQDQLNDISLSDFEREASKPTSLDLQGLREVIGKAVGKLKPREQAVIRMRYWEDLTLEEIGQNFTVTKERIRQIEIKALRKLRHPAFRLSLEKRGRNDESRRRIVATETADREGRQRAG